MVYFGSSGAAGISLGPIYDWKIYSIFYNKLPNGSVEQSKEEPGAEF